MSKTTLLCGDLPNIPWQDKPAGCTAPLWHYSDNPVIRRNPLPGVARIFNSAVMPYEGAYIGVFRGEQTNGIPYIYLGRSADGIHWTFDPEKIPFVNEKGEPAMPVYAYDPRLVKGHLLHHVVPGLLWRVHRPGQNHRFQNLHPAGESLRALQPQRRCSSPARSTACTSCSAGPRIRATPPLGTSS